MSNNYDNQISTLFLVGPTKQFKNMMHPSRYIATLIYIITMVLTLYCALKLKRIGPTLVCVMIQTAALVWYGASYIPFAQRCIRKTTGVLIA
jgi:fumarate reductase subunit D